MKPKISRQILSQTFLVALMLLCASIPAYAQDQSQYDHGTPPQHVAGISQIGSYVSTDLGTGNLGNGSLNFKIPIGEVGGRGFWLPLTLNYSSKVWSVETGTDIAEDPSYHTYPAAYAIYDDPANAIDIYERVAPGWTLGVAPMLRVRGQGMNSVFNSTTGCTDYQYVLVKLTLVLPDKGEIELRDDLTNGVPLGAIAGSDHCRNMDNSRGTRWHATDGSGTVFIADTNNGVSNGNLNGWLITGDGTRYRFDDNNVYSYDPSAYLKKQARASSITDRNGNILTISYGGQYPASSVTFTDQLGRATKIDYNVNDPETGQPLAILVTLPGYYGQSHYYKIKTGTMNQNYRSDINPTLPVINGDADGTEFYYGWSGPHTSLYPNSWGGGAEEIDGVNVLTQLLLPDGSSLNFSYNEFGEVAEVQMPTGGKVQYDYAHVGTLPAGNSMPFEVHPRVGNVSEIDRAVVARRTYPDGNISSAAESYWTYSYNSAHLDTGQTESTNAYTDVQAKASDNSTLLLNERHYFMDAKRFLTNTGGTGYTLWSTGLERRTETRDAAGNLIAASEQDWSQRVPVNWTGYSYTTQQIANDNRVNEARKILDTGSIATVHTNYAPNVAYNNPTEVLEYDYDGSLKRRTVTSYVDSSNWINGVDYTSDPVHLISLPLTKTIYDGSGNQVTQTTSEYDNYAGDNLHAQLQDYALVSGHDFSYNTSKVTRGNLTGIGHWLNSPAPARTIYSYPRYDILGNVVSTRDPKGNVVSISYSDDFGDGSNPGSGTNNPTTPTYAFPTLITSPPPNPNEPQQTARSQYDFSTGLLTGFLDRNNVKTQTIYDDPFDRPIIVKSALGINGLETHARMYYAPSTVYNISLTNNDVLTTTDQNTLDDAVLKSWTRTDGFGRTTQAWTRTPEADTEAVTVYDGLGRKRQVSNPFRPSLSEGALYTTTNYDLAGRVASVITPDNAVVTSAYSGNTVTVTDQAGKARKSVSDALGRLTSVYEDPNGLSYQTSYAYDTLDDLTTVTQGVQTRSFTYDSLKRLQSAVNPESGTVTYSYDDNGNLTQKTDARNVSSTYVYDALNRVKSRSYSDSTPAVNYSYDTVGVAYAKGRLTQVSSSVSATAYGGYDAMGRVLSSTQTTDSQSYNFGYTYDLTGALKTETYPSGRVVTDVYDSAGRLMSVTGSGNKTYANSFSYTAHGAASALKLGNNLWEHTSFNSRLQPTEIGLGTSSIDSSTLKLNYDYGSTNNNGNVQSQTITLPNLTLSQSYSYDSLNRLQTAQEINGANQTWKQTFIYDRYGNRNFDTANTTIPSPLTNLIVDSTNNRIDPNAQGQGNIVYDSAGNLTRDVSGSTYSYDAENHQTLLNNGDVQAGASYFYDGDGRRVKKVVGSNTTVFVYNAGGQVIAEYGVPTQSSGTSYLTEDSLGTPRVITNSDGSVKSRHDYLPFGEDIAAAIGNRSSVTGYSSIDDIRQKFTQKERDSETGLDYFDARYYSSVQGRFTSCDPIKISKQHIANPQRWNLYIYVIDNPLAMIDPDGRDPVGKGGGRIIDIYITITHDDRQINGKQYKPPDWRSLIQRGLDRGNIVHLYYALGEGQDSITTDKVVNSISSPGRYVIVAGHSISNEEPAPGGRLKGVGIWTADGNIGRDGVTRFTQNDDGSIRREMEPLPTFNARAIIFSGCSIDDAIPAFSQHMAHGSTLIYNNGGDDGIAATYTSERAGFAAAEVIV